MTIKEWGDYLWIRSNTLSTRLHRWWSIEKTLKFNIKLWIKK